VGRVFVLLIVVLFASLALTKLTYATECMDGAVTICEGNFGGGGEGFCDKNPEACSGGEAKYGCNNQGDCSLPAPVQAKMDQCPHGKVCEDADGTKYSWDANGNFVITSKDGVVTVWEDYIVGGSGGDPNPNDSCTPTGKSCVGSCPSTTQICTYTPCGYVINEPLTCCPAASPPGKATSPVPSDGSIDLTGGLNVTLSVTLPNNLGKEQSLSCRLSQHHFLRKQ
jgi:hypothetical protein